MSPVTGRCHVYNRSTLASRKKLSPNLPLSRFDRPSELPLLHTDSRPGLDDFQSNGIGEFNLNIPSFVPSTVGLGISYDLFTSEKIQNTADDFQRIPLATYRSHPASPSGSVYGFLDYPPEPLLNELYGHFESQLSTSCSFGSTHSGRSSPRNGLSSVSDSLSQQSLAVRFPDLEPSSLESTDQVSRLALQHISSDSHSSLSSLTDLPSSEDHFINYVAKESRMAPYPWPSHATGIYSTPKCQTRSSLDSWEEPSFVVDSAEITTEISQDPDVDYSYILFSPEQEGLCLPQSYSSDHFLPGDEPIDEERHSSCFNGDIYVNPNNVIATSETGAFYHVYPIRKRKQKQTSDYESSSPESSPFPSPPQRKPARKSRRPVKKSQLKILPIMNVGETDIPFVKTEPLVKVEPTTEDGLVDLEKGAAHGINFGTPVFDAHRGIDLDDLKSKAARFRLRNPGQEYHNTWLASFAGKLSKQGKLLDDFRCYILGCGQVNKRRDHILIHIGAHLDQRPFRCHYWYGSCRLFGNACTKLLKLSPAHRGFYARTSANGMR
jgi:hypothetical protein